MRFPFVRDIVRLARLQAQAYFGEMFVDLYDFAELLILRSNDVLASLNRLAAVVVVKRTANKKDNTEVSFKDLLLQWPDLRELKTIATKAWEVTEVFRTEGIVPRAYYVCPQVQYSHGISIFFPWTLPEGPITFEPVEGSGRNPKEFKFKTPFEIYCKYLFAERNYGDWTRFLDAFFRATLRNVRQVDFAYTEAPADKALFFERNPLAGERVVPAVDLQKTDSNTSEDVFPGTKNYPRRFYISPADCQRRLPVFGLPGSPEPDDSNVVSKPGKVSYLGWNIRGLVAEVIGLPPDKAEQSPEQSPSNSVG